MSQPRAKTGAHSFAIPHGQKLAVLLQSEIDLWGEFSFHTATEAFKRFVSHPSEVVLVHHVRNVWQNLLYGLSVRSPHVDSGMGNLVGIVKTEQEFNDGSFVTVLQHIDDCMVPR